MKKTASAVLCMAVIFCMLFTMLTFPASAEDATGSATIAYGTAYKLPTTVGNVTDIVWNGSVDALKFGTQTITGTGTGGNATYTVKVAAPKVNYKNDFDSYTTGVGSSANYSTTDLYLEYRSDAGADGNSIVEDADGGKYLKAGPSANMSMWSVIKPTNTIDGKVAMRFRLRGKDLKGEYLDIFKIYLRDADGAGFAEIHLRGGSDGDNSTPPGSATNNTKYLYARYSEDGSTWRESSGYLAKNFNGGDTGWMNMTLVIDQKTGTYSLYGENTIIFENVRFTGTSADSFVSNSKIASQICFTRRGMSGDGYMCIDDFMYLDLNDASLTYPKSNENVTQSSVNATVGETYTLPTTVGGINVKWNESSVDTSKIGRQIVTGKNDFAQDVTLKVNVGTNLVHNNTADSAVTTKSTGFYIAPADVTSGAVKIADDGSGNSVASYDATENLIAFETGSYYKKGNGGIQSKATFTCRVKFTELLEHESAGTYYTPMVMRLYGDNGSIINDVNFVWYGLYNNMYVRSSTSSFGLNWNVGKNSGIGRSTNDTDWATVKASVDVANDKITVYVNNDLIFEDVIHGDVSGLSYVGMACRQKGTKALLDDFKWYDDVNMTVPTGTMPVEAINTEVGLGTTAKNTSVSLGMSDGSTMDFPVTYTVDTSTPGYKSAVGSVEGFNTETVLINAKVLSYKPGNFVFAAEDGTTSAEPVNGGKLQSIDVTRYTASSDDAIMMVAIYDNEVLERVVPATISGVAQGETETVTINADLPDDVSNLDIRTFVWDGKNTLKPVDIDSYWESSKKNR